MRQKITCLSNNDCDNEDFAALEKMCKKLM